MGAGAIAGGAIAGAIGAAATSLGQTAINNIVNWRVAQENRNLQRETNAQNEALMREAWARDDTARQRMVADLEAAGLSKWLAAGSSPMNSSPISLTAPQNVYKADINLGGAYDAALHAYKNIQEFNRTDKEIQNLKAQNSVLNNQADYYSHLADSAKIDSLMKERDYGVWLNRKDVASTDPASLRMWSELINQLENPNSAIRNSWLGKKIFGVIKSNSSDSVGTDEGSNSYIDRFQKWLEERKKNSKVSKAVDKVTKDNPVAKSVNKAGETTRKNVFNGLKKTWNVTTGSIYRGFKGMFN